MKFKITQGSGLFARLSKMYDFALLAQDKADAWIVSNLKGPHRHWPEERTLFGSIGFVQFNGKPKPKPKDWKPVNRKANIYQPKSLRIINDLQKLPRVTHADFQDIIGYAKFYPTSQGINHVPGLVKGDGFFLINVPDDVRGYTPVDDMVEIMGSEFNALYDAAEAWRKNPENA